MKFYQILLLLSLYSMVFSMNKHEISKARMLTRYCERPDFVECFGEIAYSIKDYVRYIPSFSDRFFSISVLHSNLHIMGVKDIPKAIKERHHMEVLSEIRLVRDNNFSATTLYDDDIVVMNRTLEQIKKVPIPFDIFHELVHLVSEEGGINSNLIGCPYLEDLINYIAKKYAIAHPDKVDNKDIDNIYFNRTKN